MHLRLLALSVALLNAAAGHEFWIRPSAYWVTPPAEVDLGIRRGMDFAGDALPFSTARVAALQQVSAAGVRDALNAVPPPPGKDRIAFNLTTPGIHLLWLDTTASTITLEPDKFLGYLKDEGLDAVIAARKAAGHEGAPGRERYLRCVKTLIRAGGVSDGTYAVRTGQRLEIVPATDPFAVRPGGRLELRVLFDGRPLRGALVKAWHRAGKTLSGADGRTEADGTVVFTLPHAGEWMISLVHMIPIQDVPGFDWQSYWGNLTFALPEP